MVCLILACIVTEEGIIRKTGNKSFMLQLAAQIDEGEDVNFDEILEPHDINSLMKVWNIMSSRDLYYKLTYHV